VDRGRIDRPPRSSPVFTRFRGLEPLRSAGSSAGRSSSSVRRLRDLARLPRVGRRADGRRRMLVEFRPRLVRGGRPRRALVLRARMSLVVVDAPKVEAKNVRGHCSRSPGDGLRPSTVRKEDRGLPAGAAPVRYLYPDGLRWATAAQAAGRRRTPMRSSTTTTAHRATAPAGMSPGAANAGCQKLFAKLLQRLVVGSLTLDVREWPAPRHLRGGIRPTLDDLTPRPGEGVAPRPPAGRVVADKIDSVAAMENFGRADQSSTVTRGRRPWRARRPRVDACSRVSIAALRAA
jgi:hypothetical protein